MKQLLIILMLGLFSINCSNDKQVGLTLNRIEPMKKSTRLSYLQLKLQQLPETVFRFPVGDPIGHGYYISQGFLDTINGYGNHLGIDINGLKGGDTDLGDTIYSIGSGIVAAAEEYEYLAVYYKYNTKIVKAVYFHCNEVFPKSGDNVAKGEPIATIGNSDGIYYAHLHFEIFKDTLLTAGFYGDSAGFYNPVKVLPFYSKVKGY